MIRKKTHKYIVRKNKRSRKKYLIKKRRQKGSSKAGSSKAGSSKAGSSKAGSSKAGSSKAGSNSGPSLSVIYAKIGNYADKPQINLGNYNAPYLLTMLDPDAPAGTWTHYVAIMNNKTLLKEPYKYRPPSPPPGSGTHRYIFQAYGLPPAAQANLNNTANLPGNEYYVKVLKPFLQDKKKIGNEVIFTVSPPVLKNL